MMLIIPDVIHPRQNITELYMRKKYDVGLQLLDC